MIIRRICYLGSVRNPHVRKFANYFCEKNWDVHLITWKRPSDTCFLHLNVTLHYINIPPHNILKLGSLIEITRIIDRITPNILHAHYISTFGVISAFYKMHNNDVPLILSPQGSDVLLPGYFPLFRFMGRKLLKIAVAEATYIHVDGQNMIEVLKRLDATDSKLKHICYGVDTQKFKPNSDGKCIYKNINYGQSPIIISNRSLSKIYNIECLIQAIPLVLKRVPNAKFVIAGKGPEENKLKKLALRLDVIENVEFLGYINNSDMPRYLTSSDVYVSTSLSDGGLATSTAEAMACGLPVVITDFDDNSMWVKDGINGYLFPPKDPEILAEKIVLLLNDPGNRALFGQRNREMITKKLDLHREMDKIEALYKDLINNRGGVD